MSMKRLFGFALKTAAIAVVMLITMVLVSGLVLPPDANETDSQEAGGVMIRLFVVCAVNALILALVVTQSRWRGLPLVLGLMFAFYGVQTLIGQIEAIVFLTPLGEKWGAGSIPMLMMPLDFILSQFVIGAAQSAIGIPFASLLFGNIKRDRDERPIALTTEMGAGQWAWKLGAIIVLYELLYFGFGYYVAWKNPAVTEFYQGTDPGSFFAQMKHVATRTPTLIPFQAVRALLWTAFAFPVIRMLRHKPWLGALLTGLFVSLPMNIPHIVPNAYMPPAVRAAHFVETASSTFIFGVLMFWLLHRSYGSVGELFGFSNAERGAKELSAQPGA